MSTSPLPGELVEDVGADDVLAALRDCRPLVHKRARRLPVGEYQHIAHLGANAVCVEIVPATLRGRRVVGGAAALEPFVQVHHERKLAPPVRKKKQSVIMGMGACVRVISKAFVQLHHKRDLAPTCANNG